MSIKIINKIGILINWPREVDMYENFLKKFNKKKLVYVINDVQNYKNESLNNVRYIKNSLSRKKIKKVYLSKIYKRSKFRYLISTALANPKKITINSILKFFYGKIFGRILIMLRINLLLRLFFNRDFSAGGSEAKIYEEWFPERHLGLNTIFYPRGLDLRLKHFPNSKFEKIFDIFLCCSLLDLKLIKKKFKSKKCILIGYPRYDKEISFNQIKKKIFSEFNFSKDKKLIFWCPTHIEEKEEIFNNIILWREKIIKLKNKYNLLVRPHPKSLAMNQNLIKDLKKIGFCVDVKLNRNMHELYQVSDLVLGDYGGSVLSSIYLKKPLLLLNLPKEYSFINRLIKTEALDYKIRDKVVSLNLDQVDDFKLNNMIKNTIKKYSSKRSNLLKIKYFGNLKKNNSQIKDFVKKLSNNTFNL
tara:strand:- start:255 stop:1502 length:1248 start_codon:yes stop_codon:yes gene_type:complete